MGISWDERIESLKNIDKFEAAYKIPCADACIDFICRFCFTQNLDVEGDSIIPFDLWPKQVEFIHWLWDRYTGKKRGIVDKSRDVGATWLMVAFFVWQMIFFDDFLAGIYTLVADSCDKKGDPDSIFEKIRIILKNLPKKWTSEIKDNYMSIVNERNGSGISGGSGNNPARGGRRRIYLKDESAFYQNEMAVDASISMVSKCIIDVSTHNGTNTLFYRRTQSSPENVFIFNWWDNPFHTKEWYDNKKAEAERDGTMSNFMQEIERDPRASIPGVLIPPAWVACTPIIDNPDPDGQVVSSQDVADEGRDTNAQILRKGNHVFFIDEWSGVDVGITTDRSIDNAITYKASVYKYDNIGVGAGVKSRINRIQEQRDLPFEVIGWSASGKVMRPRDEDFSERQNKDMFANAKSQAWWALRERFYNVYRKHEGKSYDENKLITFDKSINKAILNKLMNEISQPVMKLNESGQILIDKKPKGSKSPNIADSLVINIAETENNWISWSVI